jgi:hypothetical protein
VTLQHQPENAMSKKLPELVSTEMPPPIAALVEATNAHDSDAFLATFTDDAVLTDDGHDYRGVAAIKEWSDRQYIGNQVTLDVTGVDYRDGKIVVSADVAGYFPKAGLPDPFAMDFHFAVDKSRITALSMRAAS